MARHIGIILLVGALCAIIAAVLFPTFGQAKEAARSTSATSKWKRRALAAEAQLGSSGSSEYDLSQNPSAGAPMHYAARQPGAERSTVQQAGLSVEVDNLDKAERQVRESIGAAGGYVDHLEGDDLAGDQPVMHLTIRVPQKSFDGILSSFEALGHRTQKNISSSDLTEQILTSDALIEQARQHAQDGSTNAEQIKELQAEKNQLAAKVAMSTIDLTLQQQPNAAMATAANVNWGSDTWNSALSSAMGVFRVIGAVAIWLLVYSPIWGAALAAWFFGLKAWKRHIGGPQAA